MPNISKYRVYDTDRDYSFIERLMGVPQAESRANSLQADNQWQNGDLARWRFNKYHTGYEVQVPDDSFRPGKQLLWRRTFDPKWKNSQAPAYQQWLKSPIKQQSNPPRNTSESFKTVPAPANQKTASYTCFKKQADYIDFVDNLAGSGFSDRKAQYVNLKSTLDDIAAGTIGAEQGTPAKQLWLRRWDTDEMEAPITYDDWKRRVARAIKGKSKEELDELLYNLGAFYAQTGKDQLTFPRKDFHADPDSFVGTVYKWQTYPTNISKTLIDWRNSKK